MNFSMTTGERLFLNLIKEFANEKIFPTKQYYDLRKEAIVIEISASKKDIFNQHFNLTPDEIIHKVEAICFYLGTDKKQETEKTIRFFLGSENIVIINK